MAAYIKNQLHEGDAVLCADFFCISAFGALSGDAAQDNLGICVDRGSNANCKQDFQLTWNIIPARQTFFCLHGEKIPDFGIEPKRLGQLSVFCLPEEPRDTRIERLFMSFTKEEEQVTDEMFNCKDNFYRFLKDLYAVTGNKERESFYDNLLSQCYEQAYEAFLKNAK